MIDQNQTYPMLVEFNTISVCLGYFSDKIRKFYNDFSKKYPDLYAEYNQDNNHLPNKPLNQDCIADSIFEAVKLFSPENFSNTLIVFVIQNGEKNEYDARNIQNILFDKQ